MFRCMPDVCNFHQPRKRFVGGTGLPLLKHTRQRRKRLGLFKVNVINMAGIKLMQPIHETAP